MKSESCERYFEDPEAHAAHLESCPACATFFGELDEPFLPDSPAPTVALDPQSLPIAPWESARHRSWPLVAGALLAVLAAACALFLMAGESPFRGSIRALASQFPRLGVLAEVFHLAGSAIPNAPTGWLVGIGISFLAVNALLLALLRRPPRGLDA